MASDTILDIVLLLRLSYQSGRDILHGISVAARRTRSRWRLHVVDLQEAETENALRRALAVKPAGVIANGVYIAGIGEALRDCGAPVVVIGSSLYALAARERGIARVHPDESALARIGVRHFESLGRFRSFAFVRDGSRAEKFREYLAGRGMESRVYEPDKDGAVDPVTLGAWLRALPRPAAVMAMHDAMALVVLDAARRAGLRVPRDVAVLGIDNDELFCETADPPLSSIDIDHVRLGEVAANALRRLLANPDEPSFDATMPPGAVVERQSARPVAPGATLADRAEAFIRRNATKGISAADVAVSLGASRSLLDQRFRQEKGESVLGMIHRVRLEAVAGKLAETDLAIGQITASCGFRSENHAKALFKARFGRSMREWRRARRDG